MRILLIAEKPSVARDYAAALLGIPKPEKGTTFCGSLPGNHTLTISCARGHLLELARPEAYNGIHGKDFGKWRIEDLPIVPRANWSFDDVPREENTNYLQTLRKLISDHEGCEIVNGCDAGREGELIFRKVLVHCRVDAKRTKLTRLWLNEMTTSGIRDAFRDRRPLSDYDGLSEAGHTRDQADWLSGMNKTVLATKTLPRGGGDWKVWSVGRVQTPTLALICTRDASIERFEPQSFWDAFGVFSGIVAKADLDAYASSPDRAKLLGSPRVTEEREKKTFWAKELADEFASAAKQPPIYAVSDTLSQRVAKVPLPFDLQEASKLFSNKFGWTAKESLKILQDLYEAKLISYPRTDMRYFPDSQEMKMVVGDGLRAAHGWIKQHHPSIHMAREEMVSQSDIAKSKAFSSSKVSGHDHYGLHPTHQTESLGRMDRDHLFAYFAIVQACLMAMDQPAKFKVVTREWVQMDGNARFAPARFRAGREEMIEAGWMRWRKAETESGDKDDRRPLPPLPAGSTETIQRVDLKQGSTTPPKHFTEATLLDAMKYAGETFDEANLSVDQIEALVTAMKDRGIGTAATRSSIIEELIKRGYVARKAKNLLITENGKLLVRELEKSDPIAVSARQTAEWELELKRMEQGTATLTRHTFLDQVLQQFLSVRDAYSANSARGKDPNRPELTGGTPTSVLCPKSGKPVLDRSAAWEAPGYPDVLMWKNAFGRAWTAEQFVDLLAALASAKSTKFDDLVSREGRTYSAAIGIDQKKKRFVLVEEGPTKLADAVCPKSGKPMLDRPKSFEAPGFPGVALWKEAFGRKWTALDYVRLLQGVMSKSPVEFSDLVSKSGKPYSAKLTIDTAAKKVVPIFAGNGNSTNGATSAPAKELPDALCPKTGKPLVSHGSYLVAAGWPSLKMYLSAFGRNFSPEDYVKILRATLKGDAEPFEGLVSSKTGRTYSAMLGVDPSGAKIVLTFPPKAA